MKRFSLFVVWAIAAIRVDFSHEFHISDLRQCCPRNRSVLSSSLCGGGRAPNITCNDTKPLLSFDNQFLISEDYVGVYVDIFEPDSIIREPQYVLDRLFTTLIK